MACIERMAQAGATQREDTEVAQRRMVSGARWISSFRRDLSQESQPSLRHEDLARSAVFFDSTCCWV